MEREIILEIFFALRVDSRDIDTCLLLNASVYNTTKCSRTLLRFLRNRCSSRSEILSITRYFYHTFTITWNGVELRNQAFLKFMYCKKKAARVIANTTYDFHSYHVFRDYKSPLSKRHESGLRKSRDFLEHISTLTAQQYSRILRKCERWEMPHGRTNYGTGIVLHLHCGLKQL